MCVEFRPAAVNSGLVFVQTHSPSAPIRIPAHAENRIESPRRTTLVAGGAQVEMVEHALAACAGLQVDNCEIWVNEPELPGCDGSSWDFTKALDSAGIVSQASRREQAVITETVRVGDDSSWIEAQPARESLLSIRYTLDYGNHAIGHQEFELVVTPSSFRQELAEARTFLLKSEADWLTNRGLGTRVTTDDVLVFDDDGPIENQLRFENECVRHKMLDVVGDLALAGCDIVGRVVAHRSGHQLNAALVSLVTERFCASKQRMTA